ncbi:bacillithiol biosynthesis deacetylase BshB1 [Pseudalkalibacillus decolorationis]|uniref:bacillithiol biosynthesis deacetylase BshB1 n=1 Tax=Pseudalkalibacillus decolorationis TaxID=163879 RepID=UPI00214764F5|nr:bacillithiol biosynthesis deacetylase BshB1 [Pseudalkalibacillus decolorationis]
MSQLDLLAFGAHPDDVEIGMAGTVIRHSKMGYKCGICDLTLAELSSNGTVELRQEEASEAAKVLRLHTRLNLQLPDRGLQYNSAYVNKIVEIIRTYQPKVVFLPYHEDRHPDHGNCARLVEEALFSAGIKKYQADQELPPHKVRDIYYYFINGYEHPSITVDITSVREEKLKCLQAYKSQFTLSEDGVDTPLNNGYLETVLARDTLFGKETGVKLAEGFYIKKPLLIDNFLGESL